MTRTELEKYRQILQAKQDQMMRTPHGREELIIERMPDEADEVARSEERDVAVRLLDVEARLLHDVRAALERIRRGAYGRCLDCEEAIAPKRLAAVPWASYCLVCQQHHDVGPQAAQPHLAA